MSRRPDSQGASTDESPEPSSENDKFYIGFTNIADNTTVEDVKEFLLTVIPENLHPELKRVDVFRSRKDGRALNGWVVLSSRNVFDMAMDQFRKHKLKGKLVNLIADLDDPFDIPDLKLPMNPQGQASNAHRRRQLRPGNLNAIEISPFVDSNSFREKPLAANLNSLSLQPNLGPNAEAANLTAADELPPPKAEKADTRSRTVKASERNAARKREGQAGSSSGTGGGPSSFTGKKEGPQQTKGPLVVNGSDGWDQQSKSDGKKPARD